MYVHSKPFSRFLISCKAESDKAEGAAQSIIKKMSRKGRLVPVEKLLVSAFAGSGTSTEGKAFVNDARTHGYTEIEWTYTIANTRQGKSWNIEQGSAWNIEQGSAWKIEEGENWKIEWTEANSGKRVPSAASVAMITNSFVGGD